MFSSNSNISISASLRLCLPVVALAKTGASLLFASPLPGATPPPNVILIITDDQGYGDLSAHGSPVLKTPHMDRLHAESVRFTDFHVAPMCSPTRGASCWKSAPTSPQPPTAR